MPDELKAKDAKLIQYLNEAYGKEKQLETALTAHIAMTSRAPYKKRLQQHLKETKDHARQLERRIKALGGKAEILHVPGGETAATAVSKGVAAAQRAAAAATGPLHMLRGTGEAEKLLKNAKTEFQDEAEEIATYSGIEALATAVHDKDTAKLAKSIRRDEERMRDYLARLIPQLAKAVATEEIPASERRSAGGRRRSTTRRTTSRSTAGGSRSTARTTRSRKTTGTSRSRSGSSRARTSSARSTTSRRGSSR